MGAEGTRKSGAAGGQKLGDICREERGRGGERSGAVTPTGRRMEIALASGSRHRRVSLLPHRFLRPALFLLDRN